MANTKRFELRVLLTVTTHRLLTKPEGPDDNGISALYDILGWMTNDEPFTHQLPRFNEECKPWLLRWFPELAMANESLHVLDQKMSELGAERGIEFWLANMQVVGMKAEYEVPRIPRDGHTHRNPVDELLGTIGSDKVIVVKA